MITSAGRVKVLDFGIARRTALARSGDARRHARQRTRRRSGWWSARRATWRPEQISGHPGGPPSDVFALGAVLFHMLTGTGPFAATSTWAALDATMHVEPPSVACSNRARRRGLAQVVARALAKDPDARFADGREVQQALVAGSAGRARADRGARAPGAAARWPSPRSPPWPSSPPGRSLWFRSRESQLRWVRDEAIPEIRPAVRRRAIRSAPIAWRSARWPRLPDDPAVAGGVGRGHQRHPGDLGAAGRRGVDPRALGQGRRLDRRSARTPLTARVPLGQMRWRFALERLRAARGHPQSVPGAADAGQDRLAAAGDGAGAGRRGRGSEPQRRGGAAGVLDRRHRSDQPAVQGVRRRRRLSEARVLDAAVRQGRPRR